MHSINSEDDRHTPRAFLRKFAQSIGGLPNWNPCQIVKKFGTKSNRYWHAKQKTLKPVSDFKKQFLDEEEQNRTLVNTLNRGWNFICLVKTEHFTADDETNRQRLDKFQEEYMDPCIWTMGTAKLKRPGLISPKNFSTDVIQIDELVSEPNRSERLQVFCPIDDIVMMIIFECDPHVSILYNDVYFEISKGNLKIRPECKRIFAEERTQSKTRPKSTPGPMSQPASQQDNESQETHQAEISQPDNFNRQTETKKRKVYAHGNFVVVEWDSTKKQAIPIVSAFQEPYKSAWRKTVWKPDDHDSRTERYDELFYGKVSIFKLLEKYNANDFYCIHYEELIDVQMRDRARAEWKDLVGCKMPNQSIYVLFHKSKCTDQYQTEYTGKKIS